MSAEPRGTATTVLYNSAGSIAGLCRSLRAPVEAGILDVIAVDNASPDDSAAIVAAELPGATILSSEENLGFASGSNLGWERVRGDYWLLLNPDVVVPEGGIERLIEFMDDHPELGAVSPRLRGRDGAEQSVARRFPSAGRNLFALTRLHRLLPSGLRSRMFLGSYWDHSRGDCDWVTGAALAVRREAVAAAGPLDGELFMYGEDMEWCWRIGRAGWKVGVCMDLAFTHEGGSSSAATWDYEERQRRITRGQFQALVKMRGRIRARIYAAVTSISLSLRRSRGTAQDEARRCMARCWGGLAWRS
jgi:GT2 family glycosyltransferase